MMAIHHQLKAGKYPNCSDLSDSIGVSTRTVKRDVEFMKGRLELPIEYEIGRAHV